MGNGNQLFGVGRIVWAHWVSAVVCQHVPGIVRQGGEQVWGGPEAKRGRVGPATILEGSLEIIISVISVICNFVNLRKNKSQNCNWKMELLGAGLQTILCQIVIYRLSVKKL
jgi:hypothetical protein